MALGIPYKDFHTRYKRDPRVPSFHLAEAIQLGILDNIEVLAEDCLE